VSVLIYSINEYTSYQCEYIVLMRIHCTDVNTLDQWIAFKFIISMWIQYINVFSLTYCTDVNTLDQWVVSGQTKFYPWLRSLVPTFGSIHYINVNT
jgi:hypothetical protein